MKNTNIIIHFQWNKNLFDLINIGWFTTPERWGMWVIIFGIGLELKTVKL